MKKNLSKAWLAVLLIAAMVTTGLSVISTYAQDEAVNIEAIMPPQKKARFISSYARVLGVADEGGIKSIRVQKKDETELELVLTVSEDTAFVDQKTGISVAFDSIKEGDEIFVYHSPAMSKSLPPQSPAVVILTNVEEGKATATLIDVDTVTKTKDGSVRVLSEDGGYLITISEKYPISSYQTGETAQLSDIVPGSRVLTWFEIMALSYPGQAGSDRTVILPPYTDETSVVPANIQKTESMVINGALHSLGDKKIITEGQSVMVPLRFVAETLGYAVSWDEKTHTATVDNGYTVISAKIGEDGYVRKNSDLGESGPFVLGAAPALEGASTYVPAGLFYLLMEDPNAVAVDDGVLDISIRYYIQ